MLHFVWPCCLTDDKDTSSCSCWEWFLSRTGSGLIRNQFVIVTRNKFQSQWKHTEVFNWGFAVVTFLIKFQCCHYPKGYTSRVWKDLITNWHVHATLVRIIFRCRFLIATKKPNYCRKGFEVSKVKFKLVFHSCEVYHNGKHKLLNQEVMMLFGSLHETLVPLFSRDNG